MRIIQFLLSFLHRFAFMIFSLLGQDAIQSLPVLSSELFLFLPKSAG
jgi:hypothetical protein